MDAWGALRQILTFINTRNEDFCIVKVKGIALFSGGLDSSLAFKVIQEQGIEVLGITFETPFFGAARAKAAADRIGLSLTA